MHSQVVHGTAPGTRTSESFLTVHCLLGLFCDSRLATPWLLSLAWIHRWSYCPNGCCGSLMARWALGKRVTQHSHRVREIYNINHAQKKQQSKRKEFLNLNQGLWILFITQLLGLLSLFLSKEFTAWWMLLFSIFPIISQYKRRKKKCLEELTYETFYCLLVGRSQELFFPPLTRSCHSCQGCCCQDEFTVALCANY